VRIVEQAPPDRPILFVPDANLGAWVMERTGRKMDLWQGSCYVHVEFTRDSINRIKQQYPAALVVAHPECTQAVRLLADEVCSTEKMIAYCRNAPVKDIIVVTESGMLHRLRKECPDKNLIAGPTDRCACADCRYMKLNTLQKLRDCLRDLAPRFEMDEDLRPRAELPLPGMLHQSPTAPRPCRMFLLTKIFKLRDQANPDHEKPFLEHLEDLRVMITRVVITLVVSMLGCFMFQGQLMEILRRPVDRVWEAQIVDKLPVPKDAAKPLDLATWERAKAIEHGTLGLDAGHREAFFKALGDDNLPFHAPAVALLRATLALPEGQRTAFIDAMPESADMKQQVRALLLKAPSPEMDNRGNLRMMSALKPTETFMLSMKLSFFAGIVVSFPLLLLFILQFILPGLHSHEKKVLWPALSIGFGLFLGGVLFAYYGVLPRALGFFFEWGDKMGVSNDWRIGEYITFPPQFPLAFGVAF